MYQIHKSQKDLYKGMCDHEQVKIRGVTVTHTTIQGKDLGF